MILKENKKLIILTKKDKIDSYEKMRDFIKDYFSLSEKTDIDVDCACDGILKESYWYTKKYVGFLDAKDEDIDLLYDKYKNSKYIEWLIISKT